MKKNLIILLVLILVAVGLYFVSQQKIDKVGIVNEPFQLSVGGSIVFDKNITIKFLQVAKVTSCGNDVQNCDDSISLSYQNNLTKETKEFTLNGRFYPYKINGEDIMITKKISDDTYEFKISQTQF